MKFSGILWVIVVLALALAIVACVPIQAAPQQSANAEAAEAEQPAAKAPLTYKDMTVGFIRPVLKAAGAPLTPLPSRKLRNNWASI